jgi:hypothetical protein
MFRSFLVLILCCPVIQLLGQHKVIVRLSFTDCIYCIANIDVIKSNCDRSMVYYLLEERYAGRGASLINETFGYDISENNLIYSESLYGKFDYYMGESNLIICDYSYNVINTIPLKQVKRGDIIDYCISNNNDHSNHFIYSDHICDTLNEDFNLTSNQVLHYYNDRLYFIDDFLNTPYEYQISSNQICKLFDPNKIRIDSFLHSQLSKKEIENINHFQGSSHVKSFPIVRIESMHIDSLAKCIYIGGRLANPKIKKSNPNNVILFTFPVILKYDMILNKLTDIYISKKYNHGKYFYDMSSIYFDDAKIMIKIERDDVSKNDKRNMNYAILDLNKKYLRFKKYLKWEYPALYKELGIIYEYNRTYISNNVIYYSNIPYLYNLTSDIPFIVEIDSISLNEIKKSWGDKIFNTVAIYAEKKDIINLLLLFGNELFLINFDFMQNKIIDSSRVDIRLMDDIKSKITFVNKNTIAFIDNNNFVRIEDLSRYYITNQKN